LAARYAAIPEFDVVWMLDDDVELAQLQIVDGSLTRTDQLNYFDVISDLHRDHPEVSVLVGSVCGDPPIRPQAVLATQLLDVIHAVRAARLLLRPRSKLGRAPSHAVYLAWVRSASLCERRDL
jgi:hypothetical protein